MKFDSPIFDRIRVKPHEDRRLRTDCPACDWSGCRQNATHRAPKGRAREGEYWRFCLDHVRDYNQSYNFFAGMSDNAVAEYQKDAITGHRPTWKMGVNGQNRHAGEASLDGTIDPFGMFREVGGETNWRAANERAVPEGRLIRNAERKALDVLGVEANASAP